MLISCNIDRISRKIYVPNLCMLVLKGDILIHVYISLLQFEKGVQNAQTHTYIQPRTTAVRPTFGSSLGVKKTEKCRDGQMGACKRGATCNFAHDNGELKEMQLGRLSWVSGVQGFISTVHIKSHGRIKGQPYRRIQIFQGSS